jgi:RHS repeat-associated protein
VLETNTGFSLTRAYEPNRNLITSITNSFGGTQLHRFDCTNDEIGRRTKRTDYDLSVVLSNLFAYNVRSELEEASMGTNSYSYRYDPIGNRRTATNNAEALAYAANALNQYSQISNQTSQVSPVFDLDGNMTGYKDWTFIWDAENRLVLASNATTVVSNSYDYMSRRVAKVVNGQAIVFTYQGWAMIREVSGTTSNSYVYGLDLSGTAQGAGTIGGILSASFGGTTSVSSAFYCYDANGNVTDLVGTNGEFLAQYQYDPYGNTISKSGALADVNPFRFSTKYLDAETGLYYYGYRFYNPEVGRWVNRDPLTEKGHKVSLGNKRPNFKMFNLKNDHGLLNAVRAEGVGGWHYYAFVFNNPVSAIDPTGKQPVNDVCCVSTDIPTVKCKCTFLAWKHKPTTPCTSQNQGAMEIVDFDAGCSGAGHSACIRAQCRNQGCKVRMTWYCEFIIEDNDGNVVDDPGLNWHGGSTILKDCGYAL